MAPSALRYAQEMREHFLREGAPDWEIAFVHAIHAHAAAIAGRREAHAESHALAAAALGAIADSIASIRGVVTGVASAVEEQSAVTQEISASMQLATRSVADVNRSLKALAS